MDDGPDHRPAPQGCIDVHGHRADHQDETIRGHYEETGAGTYAWTSDPKPNPEIGLSKRGNSERQGGVWGAFRPASATRRGLAGEDQAEDHTDPGRAPRRDENAHRHTGAGGARLVDGDGAPAAWASTWASVCAAAAESVSLCAMGGPALVDGSGWSTSRSAQDW